MSGTNEDGADAPAGAPAVEPLSVWERHAGWWQRGFTDGADVEYEEQMIPLALDHLAGAGRLLDLGCGEGQVARRAVAVAGGAVVGIDAAAAQLATATARAGGPAFLRGLAGALPFRDACFGAVIVCLVLEHVVDLDDAVREVARVLAPGGRFLVFLNHPLLQTPGSGWVDDHVLDPPEQYWRIGPYLEEIMTVEEFDGGVRLPFFHRPLSRYVNACADAGLVVARMEEPAPPPGFLTLAPEYHGQASIPRMLFLRAEKLPV